MYLRPFMCRYHLTFHNDRICRRGWHHWQDFEKSGKSAILRRRFDTVSEKKLHKGLSIYIYVLITWVTWHCFIDDWMLFILDVPYSYRIIYDFLRFLHTHTVFPRMQRKRGQFASSKSVLEEGSSLSNSGNAESWNNQPTPARQEETM